MTEDGLCGWVGTFEDAEKIRKAYEVDSSITFVSGKKEANFGRPEIGNVTYTYSCINVYAHIINSIFHYLLSFELLKEYYGQ